MTTATGTPVGREAVNIGWLKDALSQDGYAVTELGDNVLAAKKSGATNLVVKLVPAMSIILFQSIWKMKQGGFGAKKDILKAVNEANRESFIDTFYTDADGDLWVSSYIVLTDHITPGDVTRFLQREMLTFFAISQKSGLGEHIQ